jgi:hypothetical protein
MRRTLTEPRQPSSPAPAGVDAGLFESENRELVEQPYVLRQTELMLFC